MTLIMEIQTERLRLIPLSLNQLQWYVAAPEVLERELGFGVSRDIVTERFRRAIEMKMSKMERVDPAEHAWYTYWLIIVEDRLCGAGLAGFKGLPDDQGTIEIGYGIDPAYRNRGYMTEAVKALIAWAFQDTRCRAVIAPDTKRWNVASNRVLEKVGMRVYNETEEALDWRADKAIWATAALN
jgi:ribosomal-protein-alanine N-acetyltransferase